jgi:hypothetical protein
VRGRAEGRIYLKLEQTGTIYQTFKFSQFYTQNSRGYKLKSQSQKNLTVVPFFEHMPSKFDNIRYWYYNTQKSMLLLETVNKSQKLIWKKGEKIESCHNYFDDNL